MSWKSLYVSPGGVSVTRTASRVPFHKGLKHLLRKLDTNRGIYLSSGYEYPERYSRWDIASICPPFEMIARQRDVVIRPLNERGEVLCKILAPLLENHPHWDSFALDGSALRGRLKPLPKLFPEEERSKQPSAFSILRALIEEFRNRGFAPRAGRRIRLRSAVPVRSHRDEAAARRPQGPAPVPVRRHLFHGPQEGADRALPVRVRARRAFDRRPADAPQPKAAPVPAPSPARIVSDHTPEEYMANVETVREGMRQGDYYEVVLRQTFPRAVLRQPSELFERIQQASPSPYEFFLQFGDEQLVGASPGDVRARGRPARGNLPHLRHRAAHRRSAARRRQHPRTAEFHQGRVRADHVYRRGPQRQVARLRSGVGEGDRAAADRVLRGRVPHRGSRGRHAAGRASIRSTRFSRTCGPSP